MGGVIGGLFILTSPLLPQLFTSDSRVLAITTAGLVTVGLFQPLAALTYIYDGYLIGADDSKYLALSMGVVFILYLPSILLVRLLPAGVISLVGIWAIYGLVFIGGRALSLWLRIRTDAWM